MKTLMLVVAALLLVQAVPAQDKAEFVWFGNSKCAACEKPVDRALYVVHEGQKAWACSKDCLKKMKEDAAAAIAKAYPADKVVDVKNETCPIMGNKAKDDVSLVFQGHKVHFCCPGCNKKFMSEPNKFLALCKNKDLKLAGNKKCPVQPDDPAAPDLYMMYKGYLVGICCDSCIEDFQGNPEKFLKAAVPEKPKGG